MTTYIYEPLDYDKAQTRVVHLPPALDVSEPIRVSLQKVTIPRSCLSRPLESDFEAIDLASEGSDVEKPDFIALSYVWGSPDDPQEVIVESAPEGANKISITRNLDVAIRNVRRTRAHLVVWIDAICIDQGNLNERSYQVAFMDTIYTIASFTIVWLGPEEDDSHHAIEMITAIGRRVEATSGHTFERRPDAPPREPDEPILESMTEEMPYGEKDLSTIITFLERPWFSRLWVRQEIALADSARVQCGRSLVEWDNLRNAAVWIITKPLAPKIPNELRERRALIKKPVGNVCEVSLSLLAYEGLRRDNEGVRFTDPRDSIYAVKRLLVKRDQDLGIGPNYTLQTADVFMDVCVRILERQRLTYFLETCELTTISVPNLPSWVPDWSRPMKTTHGLISPWSACCYISANAAYHGDKILRVAGIQIDKIQSLRDLYDRVDNVVLRSNEVIFDYIWSCYPGDSLIDSPYDEEQSIIDAYCRTFCAGMFSDTYIPPDNNFQAFDEAKEALKKIWAVKDNWTGYEDSMEDPMVKKFLYICGHWVFGRCFFTTENGYVGLSPLGTQPGDTIAVILGCQFPVVLREEPASSVKSDETKWKVVGVCYANGLMDGEAILGRLPSHYKPVVCFQIAEEHRIFGNNGGILDKRTDDLKNDPAALLEEFGIQTSVWSREPHRLEVSESVLQEAGVKLRDFFLV